MWVIVHVVDGLTQFGQCLPVRFVLFGWFFVLGSSVILSRVDPDGGLLCLLVMYQDLWLYFFIYK